MTIIEFYDKYSEQFIIIIVLILYFILDLYLRNRSKKLKKSLYEKYNIIEQKWQNVSDIRNISEEDQLNYYKNKNFISFIRFWVLFFLISFYVLNKYPNFFSLFDIAIWAIIITFKEIIQSFVWFFYVSTQYKIWDDIIINDWKTELRWEIIYINIMNIGIVWRDENWENNWQFYRVPNYKFLSDIIKKEDISLHKYKKENIIIFYKKDDFSISFDEFMEKLSEYLEENLPKRTINNVWNFKTFIWYKYKMRFEYEKELLKIKISFIVRPRNIFQIEKWLFSFIESIKK
jgi:hypothetical protein